MNTPTLNQMLAARTALGDIIREAHPASWVSPITISISAENEFQFNASAWISTEHIQSTEASLDDLIAAFREAVANFDPDHELREKAEKLGYELVKKGGDDE